MVPTFFLSILVGEPKPQKKDREGHYLVSGILPGMDTPSSMRYFCDIWTFAVSPGKNTVNMSSKDMFPWNQRGEITHIHFSKCTLRASTAPGIDTPIISCETCAGKEKTEAHPATWMLAHLQVPRSMEFTWRIELPSGILGPEPPPPRECRRMRSADESLRPG